MFVADTTQPEICKNHGEYRRNANTVVEIFEFVKSGHKSIRLVFSKETIVLSAFEGVEGRT
jgi:hypothetical protein